MRIPSSVTPALNWSSVMAMRGNASDSSVCASAPPENVKYTLRFSSTVSSLLQHGGHLTLVVEGENRYVWQIPARAESDMRYMWQIPLSKHT